MMLLLRLGSSLKINIRNSDDADDF